MRFDGEPLHLHGQMSIDSHEYLSGGLVFKFRPSGDTDTNRIPSHHSYAIGISANQKVLESNTSYLSLR